MPGSHQSTSSSEHLVPPTGLYLIQSGNLTMNVGMERCTMGFPAPEHDYGRSCR